MLAAHQQFIQGVFSQNFAGVLSLTDYAVWLMKNKRHPFIYTKKIWMNDGKLHSQGIEKLGEGLREIHEVTRLKKPLDTRLRCPETWHAMELI